MLSQLAALVRANFKAILRDRILHAVGVVAVLMLVMVPTFSTFSMRQVQELAVSLALSGVSFVLLVLTLLLGSTSVWRDIERRYTATLLPLPITRATYLLGRFFAAALFIVAAGLLLGVAAGLVIALVAHQYPSDVPLAWGCIVLALAADILKYLLLAGIALLLSAVSTSFFLPFFGATAIYLAGSASQEVYEYVSGQYGAEIKPLALAAIKGAYWLLPNFAAFNFKVQAVYALAVSRAEIIFPLGYGLIYGAIILTLAVWAFARRQLP
jgi:ABC-type transport system involved in multi-copper enzyme maturation permease subunit